MASPYAPGKDPREQFGPFQDNDPVAIGLQALKSGAVTVPEAQAAAKQMGAGKKKKSPYLSAVPPPGVSTQLPDEVKGQAQVQDQAVNSNIAQNQMAQAQNNQQQVMAQVAAPSVAMPAGVAKGSGLTKSITGENKVSDQASTEEKTTDSSESKRNTLIDNLQKQINSNTDRTGKLLSADQIIPTAEIYQGLPGYQDYKQGEGQLQNMIAMEANRKIHPNIAGPLAMLADVMNGGKTHFSQDIPMGQETQADRAKTILAYQQKLQADRKASMDNIVNAIGKSKGGFSQLQDAITNVDQRKQLEQMITKAQTEDDKKNVATATATAGVKNTATDPNMHAGLANTMERQDRQDRRTIVQNVQKDPILNKQLLSANSIVTQFHQLALPTVTPQQIMEAMQTLRNTTTGMSGGGRSGVTERADTYMQSIPRAMDNLIQKFGSVENIPPTDPQLMQVKKEAAQAYSSLREARRDLVRTRMTGFKDVLARRPDFADAVEELGSSQENLLPAGAAPSVQGVEKHAREQADTHGYDGSGPLPANATLAQKQARRAFLEKKGGQ